MPNKTHLKVAFATTDQQHVDAGFEQTKQIVVYDLGPESAQELEVIRYGVHKQVDGGEKKGNKGGCGAGSGDPSSVDEQKIAKRVANLKGVSVLMVSRPLNPISALQLHHAGIFPVKIDAPEPIHAAIPRLQEMLRGRTPLWMQRLLSEAPEPDPHSSSLSEKELLQEPFLRMLVAILRAHDTSDVWNNKPDIDLLKRYTENKKKPAAAECSCAPDGAAMLGIETFFAAVSREIESHTQLSTRSQVSVSSEGFGNAIVITGRLVVVSKPIRDANRFGFDSIAMLLDEGVHLIETAKRWIEQYPNVARAEST